MTSGLSHVPKDSLIKYFLPIQSLNKNFTCNNLCAISNLCWLLNMPQK